jgi:hypothetical protein
LNQEEGVRIHPNMTHSCLTQKQEKELLALSNLQNVEKTIEIKFDPDKFNEELARLVFQPFIGDFY